MVVSSVLAVMPSVVIGVVQGGPVLAHGFSKRPQPWRGRRQVADIARETRSTINMLICTWRGHRIRCISAKIDVKELWVCTQDRGEHCSGFSAGTRGSYIRPRNGHGWDHQEGYKEGADMEGIRAMKLKR